ncbi:helix-turn-helix transcriptional regulator [Clostridium botulinum]|nr:hypothetical protein KU40_04940 [Clostridium botulinum]MBY6778573.1 helix-turn-helix transcriptional regulator [Clostridium botulinum]MBY6851752.1 helix-turn-helix transcriptional regulator [Clostridium botulinum]NFF21836.1 helix-turn-helix transcriptional regulator [Clostridium botulinum]NFF37426.1 helix-turn-helix transcriptional regulator [Clostridium botulinum]
MNTDILRQTMQEKNIKVGELAKLAKVGQATISEILNDIRKDVKLSTADKIATALDIDLRELCKEELKSVNSKKK